jgi:hypothetical protein
MKHYMKHYFFGTLLLAFTTNSCSASQPVTASELLTPVIKTSAAIAPIKIPAVPVKISNNEQALLPILISSSATDREKAAAQTLADYLQKISGATFKVDAGAKVLSANSKGIAIGSPAEFPDLANQFDLNDPTKTEDYLLRSHANGVLLVGASDTAVEHAVWDFLYRLGYRQFFPGADWEIISSEKNLNISVSTFEHPDYYSRRIWPGFGNLKENKDAYANWDARNRMGSGVELSTGHAYGAIIHRHEAEFKAHPEYLTHPGSSKFCVSNPGLQQLVINDALAQLEKDPSLQSISMEPSDGGGWESDACPDATVYKSITDRAVSLANMVAEAIAKKYSGKYVGLYAYSSHSPPPTIKVNPQVIPSIATSFISGGYTVDGLLAGWHQQAEHLGIREYYSVNTWDRDLPGHARGSNINYLKTTIPHFYDEGARFLSAESSDNFGPNGLGYYIATRLMWNTADAAHVDEIENDFFTKSFGPAKAPMAEFYHLIDGSNKPLLSDDLIGRMYRQLNDALKLTDDPAIQKRIDDLALYTRYVELFSAYSQAKGDARQADFEALMRFTWRIRTTQMVHTLALWRDLANRDKSVKFPEGSGYRVAEDKDPWKSNEPFTAAQIQQMITDGIANNKLLDFTPVSYSDDLVPATPLQLKSDKPGSFNMLRGNSNLYTWISIAPATINLQSSAGLIYGDRGAAKFELFPIAETGGNSVANGEVAPDKQLHQVPLKSTFDGLQRIHISDGSAGTSVDWPAGTPMVMESSIDNAPTMAGGRWTMYFYVPKGTKTIGGYRSAVGTLKSPDGKTALTFAGDNNPGYWSVPVPAGQDGKLWQLYSMSGTVKLMTVPPYLARSADEMLLPAEVIKADK